MLTDAEDVTVTVTNVTFSTLLSTADVGDQSAPAFGDVDGDGDTDLVVGEFFGILLFYRWGDAAGTGTGWSEVTGASNNPFHVDNPGATTPETFDVIDQSRPAFGDVDGDGDMDVLLGQTGGGDEFHFFRRGTAMDGADADSGKSWSDQGGTFSDPVINTTVPVNAAPTFSDVDGDGDLDLLVGTSTGTLFFRRWGAADGTGTGWSTEDPSVNPFNGIKVSIQSRPAFGDVDDDGDTDLVVGAFDGKLAFFRRGTATDGADADSGKSWTAVTGTDNPFNAPNDDDEFDVGIGSSPDFGDVDGDGDTDLVVGDRSSRTLTIWYRLSDGTWSQTSDAI